jgi:hypothetical protein
MKTFRQYYVVWAARAGLCLLWIAILAVNARNPAIWLPDRAPLMIALDVIVLPALALLMVALAAEVLLEEGVRGRMQERTRALLVWAPRVLGLLLCAFLSVFALDVFGRGLGLWQTIGALLVHLAPTLALAALLVASWRWEWLGAAAFGLFGLWTLANNLGGPVPLAVLLLVSVTPLLIAALLALAWVYRRETHAVRRIVTR